MRPSRSHRRGSRSIPPCEGTIPQDRRLPGRLRSIPPCEGTMSRLLGSRSRPTCGPSPRARGRCGKEGRRRRRVRSIPPCEGTISPRTVRARSAFGPSPRARGRFELAPIRRTTPAVHPPVRGDDGHTRASRPTRAVHPPVRGDDRFPSDLPASLSGPSPRARGRSDPRPARVLPRGSSPHVWGKGGVRERGFQHPRFIPTCVGKRESELPMSGGTVHGAEAIESRPNPYALPPPTPFRRDSWNRATSTTRRTPLNSTA